MVWTEVASRLLGNLLCLAFALGVVIKSNMLQPSNQPARWLARGGAQRATELWMLRYAAFWVGCFALIVGSGAYEGFGPRAYLLVCAGLAAPLLLQPILAPGLTGEASAPLAQRCSFRANLWLAIFSFVGNYFYTHYFTRVLGAEYTMPSWDLNGVPLPMYFATHFYFSLYHTLAGLALRRVRSAYAPSAGRAAFVGAVVCVMAYATALTETVTISGFPCWRFDDWESAVTVASGYYALYFVVSYPMYSRLERVGAGGHSTERVVTEALATCMAVLLLLDFVRLALGVDFEMKQLRPCKVDPSRACAPFDAC